MQYTLFESYADIRRLGLTAYMLENLDVLLSFTKGKGVSVFFGTPFEFILSMDPHQRGKLGELFIKLLAKDLGFDVSDPDPGHGDTVINGDDVEVKFTRQTEVGSFVVNQIRDQEYLYVALVVMTPVRIELFTIPKDKLINNQHTHGQHGGNGSSETKIYTAKSYQELIYDFGNYSGVDCFYDTFKVKHHG